MTKSKVLLTINSIIFGISGLSAIVFPEKVLILYGVEIGASIALMAQYAGLGSVAIALIIWFARNMKDLKAQKQIVFALLITYIIGTTISIFGTVSKIMHNGWPVVGLYALLSLGYLYVYLTGEKQR